MDKPLLLVYDAWDAEDFPRLRTCLSSAGTVKTIDAAKTGPALVQAMAKKSGYDVLIASTSFMQLVFEEPKAKRASYAGSFIEKDGVEYVVLPELKNLRLGAQYKFLMEHYISKLTRPRAWLPIPKFTWEIGSDLNMPAILERFSTASIIATDIETAKLPRLHMTMVGFCGIWIEADGTIRTHTVVIPFNAGFPNCTLWADKMCNLPAAKVFQGGRYDIAYLAAYGISPVNYLWDTMQMFHAWYAELPKDLGAISAFTMRTARYWKDLADSGSSYDKMLYNALDCWNTANSLIYLLIKMPDWARKNYVKKFPLIYPAHMCEMRGIPVDIELQRTVKKNLQDKAMAVEDKLARCAGVPGFNANSSKQVKALMAVLGADLESTDEKNLESASYKDPFVGLFADMILEIRGLNKLIGTYLVEEKLFKGRWMASLLPYGTETGRNSSGEMAFWCGQNLQNIPARDGPVIKQFLLPDEGFMLAECDSEQAESRDTAYIAGEAHLIKILESPDDDFHSYNAAAFFGMPYEQLYDKTTHKKLNKPIRDLAKRVNHGANYCMGENVLVQTMGKKNIDYARKVLSLQRWWSYAKVAGFLLDRFHATYPGIRGRYYPAVVRKVETTKMLTGPMGWTRFCFGDTKIKSDFNKYMAHGPQSNNAMRLDEAFLCVFLELAIHPEHSKNIKIYMQIHDSILFAFRKGHEYLIQEVVNRMQIPITVTGCDGITRTYTVPAAAKAGKEGKGAVRWSETE